MPRLDKTGPMGQGPMTGRGLGSCTGNSNPGFANYFFARGNGRGRRLRFGRGMGFVGNNYSYGNFPFPNLSKDEEINMLQAQAKNLERGLREIKKRIDELKKSDESD